MQDQDRQLRMRQLSALLTHAARHSPYYREQPWAARLRKRDKLAFRDLPITPKGLVRQQTPQFYCENLGPQHGEVFMKHTSGSSGEPMAVRKTALHFRINHAENRRLMLGWDIPSHARSAEILFPDEEHPVGFRRERVPGRNRKKWEFSTLDADDALAFLGETAATFLQAFPSIVQAALERSFETSQPVQLELIATISEVLPDDLRDLVRRIPDCRLVDRYGCVEAGLIAVQCPQCNDYHPANRHLVLEILAEDGQPAAPGALGRVVVTPLFNYAMPLIRYETGDYAVAGKPDGCPRSHRSISRIVGRESGLFKLAGGGRVAAMLPAGIAHMLGVRQYKLFQTSLTEVELHYVPRPGNASLEDSQAQAIVDRYLSTRFRVRCRTVNEIARAPSGKYIMHESLI
jgi:phenylacetate-CoA ligase